MVLLINMYLCAKPTRLHNTPGWKGAMRNEVFCEGMKKTSRQRRTGIRTTDVPTTLVHRNSTILCKGWRRNKKTRAAPYFQDLQFRSKTRFICEYIHEVWLQVIVILIFLLPFEDFCTLYSFYTFALFRVI